MENVLIFEFQPNNIHFIREKFERKRKQRISRHSNRFIVCSVQYKRYSRSRHRMSGKRITFHFFFRLDNKIITQRNEKFKFRFTELMLNDGQFYF